MSWCGRVFWLLTCLVGWFGVAHGSALDTEGAWHEFLTAGMPPCEDATAAADFVRRRVYLFGPRYAPLAGDNSADLYVLDLAASPPSLDRVSAIGPGPSPRFGSRLVFDARGDRLLLVGGRSLESAITETEVWELALTEPPRWHRLEPVGPRPTSRQQPAVAIDPVRHQLLLYGGLHREATSDVTLDEIWALSLSPVLAWTKVTPAGSVPPAIRGASAIYDSRRDQVLFHGGFFQDRFTSPASQETWRLTLNDIPTWSHLPVTGALPSADDAGGEQTAVYDSLADRMVVFASRAPGYASNHFGVATLELGGDAHWTVPATQADPGLRFGAAVAVLGGTVYCIGGRKDPPAFTSAVLALSLDTMAWRDVAPAGVQPGRELASARAAFDAAGARVFLRGGTPETLWLLELGETPRWRSLGVDTGFTRASVPMAWDAAGARLLSLDNTPGEPVRVWSRDPEAGEPWVLLPTANGAPLGRGGAAIVHDDLTRRWLLIGGDQNTATQQEVWQLRLAGVPTWDTLPRYPVPRAIPLCAVDHYRGELIVHGGLFWFSSRSFPEWMPEIYRRSLTSDVTPWLLVPPAMAPPSGLQAVVDDPLRRRLLFKSNAGVWELTLTPTSAPTAHWRSLSSTDPPEAFVGPMIPDQARDRLLFPITDHGIGYELRFGARPVPSLACPEPGIWSPGSVREIAFALADRTGSPILHEYTLLCERNWPGLPVSGLAVPDGLGALYVPIRVPIPDTASLGAVRFTLSVVTRETGAVPTECEFSLTGVEAPILAADTRVSPDRVVVRWRTREPGMDVSIARRAEAGPWQIVSSQRLSQPGTFEYSDADVATDQRYYYRAEVHDPLRAGAYGEVRVDIPLWSLGFAPEQENPIRGEFTVRCSAPRAGALRLEVFDVLGRRIRSIVSSVPAAGRATLRVPDGGSMPPGLYLVRLTQAGEFRERRVVLLR